MPPLMFAAGAVSAVTGAAVGTLLPPVAYRLSVPRAEPPRSACAACSVALPAGAAGWLPVRARCRACGARLGPPRWALAAAAGSTAGLLGAALGPVPVLGVFVAMGLLGVLLAAIDIACHRLPDQLVLPAVGATPVLLAAVAASTGAWADWWRGLVAFVVLGVVFAVLALLPGGGFGPGDAKVGALLGWYLGWLGWPAVLLGALLPWLVNAPVVLVLLATRRVDRKSRLAFGPALLTGGLLAVLMVIWARTLALP